MRRLCLILSILIITCPLFVRGSADPFPVPAGLEARVQFWVDVFSKHTRSHRIIHDTDAPERVYAVLDLSAVFPGGQWTRSQEAKVLKYEIGRIEKILQKLSRHQEPGDDLSGEERRIYRLFGDRPGSRVVLQAAKRIHVQDGMREAFREGIVRSGQYLESIRKILREEGVPEDLAYLPHVESSFNVLAHSRSGAVGMWQFTRSTGRYYLKIHRDLDERRDPFVSTRAAARLLKSNFRALRSWPLAVMAYNYGTAGMQRAVRQVGSRDVAKIVRSFRSSRFGYASKNFYFEFVAAIRVATDVERFFGPQDLAPALRYRSVELDSPQILRLVLETYGVTAEAIRSLNPALGRDILSEQKPIPRGTRIHLPVDDGPVLAINPASPAGESESAVNDATGFLASVFQSLRLLFGNAEPVADVPDKPVLAVTSADSVQSGASQTEILIADESVSTKRPDTTVLLLDGDRLVVQPEETLGHYADWLEIPTQTLRNLNGLRFGQNIRVGQRLRMAYHRISQETFSQRRTAYHQAMWEKFFQQYSIQDSVVHTVRPGESLWTVANREYGVPLWLLMAFNGLDRPDRVRTGERVIVPIIAKRRSGVQRAVETGNDG